MNLNQFSTSNSIVTEEKDNFTNIISKIVNIVTHFQESRVIPGSSAYMYIPREKSIHFNMRDDV